MFETVCVRFVVDMNLELDEVVEDGCHDFRWLSSPVWRLVILIFTSYPSLTLVTVSP